MAEGVRGSCPDNCQALTRTTGYQAKVGPDRELYRAPANGRIVAWSVALGKPGPKQTAFFEERYGGTRRRRSSCSTPARSSAARSSRRRRCSGSRTTSARPSSSRSRDAADPQGPVHRADGRRRGRRRLQIGLPSDTSWRSSRAPTGCLDTTTQFALARRSHDALFRCLYKTARLTYSATFIPSPTPPTSASARQAPPRLSRAGRRRGCRGRSPRRPDRRARRRRSSAFRRRCRRCPRRRSSRRAAASAARRPAEGPRRPAGGARAERRWWTSTWTSSRSSSRPAATSVVSVGIVRSGDVRGMSLDSSSSAPQALSPPARASAASSATQRGRIGDPAQSTGSMRRSQCGQSLRSRWASWSHQLQKRRCSTAHGSLDGDGASGRTFATTSRRLAVLAVDVHAAGLGLDDDLAARGGRPHAVALGDRHGANPTNPWGRDACASGSRGPARPPAGGAASVGLLG